MRASRFSICALCWLLSLVLWSSADRLLAQGTILYVTAPVGEFLDPEWIERLEGQGYTVNQFVSQGASCEDTIAAAEASDAVIISESISSTSMNVCEGVFALKDVAVPILSYEFAMYDDAQWTGPVNNIDLGALGERSAKEFSDTINLLVEHPLTPGCCGEIQVWNEPCSINYGTPTGDATILATVNVDEELGDQPSIFLYEAGDMLVDGSIAPAPRIGYWLGQDPCDPTIGNMTAAGLAMIDAAVEWMVGPQEEGMVWDVNADFSFEDNPNGAWSYHDVRDGALLMPTTQGIGSTPGGWSPDGTANTFPTLFTDQWSSVQEECEVGGAGPLEIRWTSPIDGTIGIRYTLHQLFEDLREIGVEIFHNGSPVEGSLLLAARHATDKATRTHPFFQVPESPGTRAHVVDAALTLDVAVGDTVSYVQRAARDIEGDDETFGISSLIIMEGRLPTPCLENCSNGIDDDGDGMTDCLDEECRCNTVDDDSSNVKFPTLFDTNIEIDAQGVTTAGHTTASAWDECPIPAEGFLPVSFVNGCWAVDSTVEFGTALVTVTGETPTADVSEADVNRTVLVKIDNDTSEILAVGSRTVGTSGGNYEVAIQSTVDSFSTLALAIPTEPVCEPTEPDGEVSCDDGIDNDCDDLTDGDDIDCQCKATEPDGEVTCDDGIDNDCDDLTDGDDIDCQCKATEPDGEATCDDGIDNDCDDLVDDADDDCQGVGPFLRGDCDGNGVVGGSPTEAIVLLGFSFRGDPPPDCLAACDAEANGSLGVTDALRILRHSFLGIGEPDPPFPECVKSTAETDETLGCEVPFCSE